MGQLALRYLGICGCIAAFSACGGRTPIELWEQPATQSGGASGGVAAGSGGPEVCNGLDDDGDGEIDEDLPLAVEGEPVAVRVDEGRTDDGGNTNCDLCGWAWDPQLVMPGNELGVVWFLGIDGVSPRPTGFFRRLSWELEPRGAVSSLGDRDLLETLGRGRTRTGTELLVFNERYNPTDFSSFAPLGSGFELGASVALDVCASAASALGSLSVLLPGLIGCANFGHYHTFMITDDGRGVLSHVDHTLSTTGNAYVHSSGRAFAALNGDSGLLAMPLNLNNGRDQLWTRRISARGEALGEPLQVLDSSQYLELEGLFSVPDGYLLFGADRSPLTPSQGRFTLALGLDGRPRGEPAYYDLELGGADAIATIRVGSGIVLALASAQGLLVEQLDASGAITAQSLLELPIFYALTPSLLFAHGHLYVAYAEDQRQGGPNRVMALRFGCARAH
ncbi:MAG TPA: hypothetical protein VER96_09385 [Polyangiaceae bacterium]|nr:hypothetical protein [Polyangiaceae bacterium]